jgi:hypothetical protein
MKGRIEKAANIVVIVFAVAVGSMFLKDRLSTFRSFLSGARGKMIADRHDNYSIGLPKSFGFGTRFQARARIDYVRLALAENMGISEPAWCGSVKTMRPLPSLATARERQKAKSSLKSRIFASGS